MERRAWFSESDAKLIARMVQWWRGKSDSSPTVGTQPQLILRPAKIISCQNSNGYGTIQFYTGDPDGLTLDTSYTVKCVVPSWFQKNQRVAVAPYAGPNVHWIVVVVLPVDQPTFYADPATDGSTLASVQDDPDAATTCSDTVSVP